MVIVFFINNLINSLNVLKSRFFTQQLCHWYFWWLLISLSEMNYFKLYEIRSGVSKLQFWGQIQLTVYFSLALWLRMNFTFPMGCLKEEEYVTQAVWVPECLKYLLSGPLHFIFLNPTTLGKMPPGLFILLIVVSINFVFLLYSLTCV